MRTPVCVLVVAILMISVNFASASIKVSAVQMRSTANLQTNVDKICQFISTLSAQGVQILVFPECALTSYTTSVITSTSQPALAAALETIRLDCDSHNVYAIVGSPEFRTDGKLWNTAFVFGPTGLIVERYHKVQLVEGWCEAGDHLARFDIAGTKGTIIICHDERYPELVRLPIIAGARIIFYISCESGFGAEEKWDPYRAQIQARAAENCVYVVHANTPANDDLSGSHGQSRIITPDGTVVAEASIFGEDVVTYSLDMSQATAAYALRSRDTPPNSFLLPFWNEGLKLFP